MCPGCTVPFCHGIIVIKDLFLRAKTYGRCVVPDNFTDPAHYGRVFGPLLLHELWAQIEDTKQNALEFYSCTISARSHSDTWVDIEAAIQEGVRKDWYLMENDVVLLRSREGDKSVMAKASSSKQSNSGLACRLRVVADGNDHGLQINTVWKLAKLFRYLLTGCYTSPALTGILFQLEHDSSRIFCPRHASLLR